MSNGPATSLNDLIGQGFVRRNTGHGHPMRPEYLLTEDGLAIRAITMGLKSMLAERWAARILIDAYPPATGYELLPKGRQVLARVSGLY